MNRVGADARATNESSSYSHRSYNNSNVTTNSGKSVPTTQDLLAKYNRSTANDSKSIRSVGGNISSSHQSLESQTKRK